jgi:hypothetical protein
MAAQLSVPEAQRLKEVEADMRALRRHDTLAEKRRLETEARLSALDVEVMALEVRVKKVEDDGIRKYLTPKVILGVLAAVGLIRADVVAKLLAVLA